MLTTALFSDVEYIQTDKYAEPQVAWNYLNAMASTLSEEERALRIVEIDEIQSKLKRRMLGNIKFIGALCRNGMLKPQVMVECLGTIMGNATCWKPLEEKDIELLCKLLHTVGTVLDSVPKSKVEFESFMDRISQLASDKTLNSRMRFSLEEILALRANNWQARRAQEGPSTLQAVHQKVAQEEESKRQMAMQLTRRLTPTGSAGTPSYGQGVSVNLSQDGRLGLVPPQMQLPAPAMNQRFVHNNTFAARAPPYGGGVTSSPNIPGFSQAGYPTYGPATGRDQGFGSATDPRRISDGETNSAALHPRGVSGEIYMDGPQYSGPLPTMRREPFVPHGSGTIPFDVGVANQMLMANPAAGVVLDRLNLREAEEAITLTLKELIKRRDVDGAVTCYFSFVDNISLLCLSPTTTIVLVSKCVKTFITDCAAREDFQDLILAFLERFMPRFLARPEDVEVAITSCEEVVALADTSIDFTKVPSSYLYLCEYLHCNFSSYSRLH